MKESEVKNIVRDRYGKIAAESSSCCGPVKACGCGTNTAQSMSRRIGYTDEEINAVPDGANLGLGCGNPVAIASLKAGETVLDLGSGAGFDCFLAAKKVGPKGRVIGVDMTAEMLDKARTNADNGGYKNVEFRLGEIENLPAGDNSVDVIISNCVINLSPDKRRVFRDAFRVLKPGGRIMVSDIVLTQPIPDKIRNSIEAYIGCVAGAEIKDKYLAAVKDAGFTGVEIADQVVFPLEMLNNDPAVGQAIKTLSLTEDMVKEVASSVLSVKVAAAKPLR